MASSHCLKIDITLCDLDGNTVHNLPSRKLSQQIVHVENIDNRPTYAQIWSTPLDSRVEYPSSRFHPASKIETHVGAGDHDYATEGIIYAGEDTKVPIRVQIEIDVDTRIRNVGAWDSRKFMSIYFDCVPSNE